MPRRGATTTQSNVARAIRAAQQTGADHIVVRPDGTIIIATAKTGRAAVESDNKLADKPDPNAQSDIIL